jgi:hypothetical protein
MFTKRSLLPSKHLALLLLALLALAVAGCGASSSGSSGSSITKGQFINRGDQICKKAQAKKEAVLKRLIAENGDKPPLSKSEQEEVITQQILPPWEKMSDEMAALGIPAEGEDEAKEIVEGYDEAVESISNDPLGAVEGATSFGKANKVASRYGFKVCPNT